MQPSPAGDHMMTAVSAESLCTYKRSFFPRQADYFLRAERSHDGEHVSISGLTGREMLGRTAVDVASDILVRRLRSDDPLYNNACLHSLDARCLDNAARERSMWSLCPISSVLFVGH